MIITLSRLQGVPPWYHTTTPHTRSQQSILIACLLGENSLYECERVLHTSCRPRHLISTDLYFMALCILQFSITVSADASELSLSSILRFSLR